MATSELLSPTSSGSEEALIKTHLSLTGATGEAGLGMKTAMHRFDHMADSFENALRSSADELASCGIPKTKDLCRRILSASGYRNII